MTFNEWLSIAGPFASFTGALVAISGGALLWLRYRREVKKEKAELAQKEVSDEQAAAAKIVELDISREELVQRIGNSLLQDLRLELTRSNEARAEQAKQLTDQGREMEEMRTQIRSLHDAQRLSLHNEKQLISHIKLLETGYAYPPGPPERPNWNLLSQHGPSPA